MLKLDIHPADTDTLADDVQEPAGFFCAKVSERNTGNDIIRFCQAAPADLRKQVFGRSGEEFHPASVPCSCQVGLAIPGQSWIDLTGQNLS
jgi:hypothetical protein